MQETDKILAQNEVIIQQNSRIISMLGKLFDTKIKETYTVSQISKITQIPASTIYRYIDQGKIETIGFAKGKKRIPGTEILKIQNIKHD